MKQRTWFITIQLHPPQILQSRFTCIKLLIYNSSCFLSTLCSPNPWTPCLLLRKSITGAQFYLVWKLAPPIIQLYSASMHFFYYYYFVVLWDLFFFFSFLTEMQIGFSSILLQCRCQGLPLQLQTTEESQHLEGDYNCLMYKNVQWLLLTYIL